MKKKFLIIILVITSLALCGCSSNKANDTTNDKNTISVGSNSIDIETPFILNEATLFPCPFAIDSDKVIFPNPNDNNKISLIKDPLPKSYISTKDVVDFVNYSTSTLAFTDSNIYFGNSSDGDSLCSINFNDKTFKKLNNNKVHNLIASNNILYYINKADSYKLYCYDIDSTKSEAISSDRIGKFIINGDNIIYQNLSDKDKLYKINKDGKKKTCLSDFAVDSFVIYNNKILTFNSSDNNNLYSIDPTDLTATRLSIMKGTNLKIFNNYLYYINPDDAKHLYSLSVNIDTKAVSSSLIYDDGVNEYYPTEKGIFIEKSVNINNTYIYILSK